MTVLLGYCHLLQMILSTNTNLYRCLLNDSVLFVIPSKILNESCSVTVVSQLCLTRTLKLMDFYFSRCHLLLKSLKAFLMTPLRMLHAGSGPVTGVSDPRFGIESALSLPAIPLMSQHPYQLCTVMFCLCYWGLQAGSPRLILSSTGESYTLSVT